VLPVEARREGLRILFYIGRALATLGHSIDDGSFDQPAASIAFAKRSVGHLNEALGRMHKLVQDYPRLANILKALDRHLLQARSSIVDYLHECRDKS
jgi:hypothetical protein